MNKLKGRQKELRFLHKVYNISKNIISNTIINLPATCILLASSLGIATLLGTTIKTTTALAIGTLTTFTLASICGIVANIA